MSSNPFDSIESKITALSEQVAFLTNLLVEKNTAQPLAPVTNEQHFTPKELAKYWGVHEQTILRQKREGLIPFHQGGGRKIFFKKSEVDAITSHKIQKRFASNRA